MRSRTGQQRATSAEVILEHASVVGASSTAGEITIAYGRTLLAPSGIGGSLVLPLGPMVSRVAPAFRMLIRMHSTSVRIDSATHEELKRLAAELHTTVGNTVTLAVRALRQDRVGAQLTEPLRDDETGWLDADLG